MAEQSKKVQPIKGKSESQIAIESAFATSFRILKFVMYIVLLYLFLSGMFSVQQNQKAVVLRFGKLKGTYGPGFHFALPYPVDKVEKVNVEEVKSIQLDRIFWHKEIAEGATPMPLIPSLEYGYTLTSDANIIHSKWVLLYKVNDPEKYILQIANPDDLLSSLLNSAIVEGSVEFTVDEATRTNKEDLRQTVERVFRQKLVAAGHDDTFIIQGIDAVAVKPPPQTEKDFAEVIGAMQERDRKFSDARGEADQIRNEAGGIAAQALVDAIEKYTAALSSGDITGIKELEKNVDALLIQSGGMASQLISKAEAYKKLIVTEAASDADRIQELAAQYKENPAILISEKLFELYLEVFKDRIMYVLGETTAKGGREVRIQINPDPNIEREERQKVFIEELTSPK